MAASKGKAAARSGQYIREDGIGITDAFRRYALPLIAGEAEVEIGLDSPAGVCQTGQTHGGQKDRARVSCQVGTGRPGPKQAGRG